jgi:hypothetical protein
VKALLGPRKDSVQTRPAIDRGRGIVSCGSRGYIIQSIAQGTGLDTLVIFAKLPTFRAIDGAHGPGCTEKRGVSVTFGIMRRLRPALEAGKRL